MEIAAFEKRHLEAASRLLKDYRGHGLSDSVPSLIKEYPALVAVDNCRIVGFCYSKPFAPDMLELLNIFISKTYRAHGVGSMLLQAFETTASEKYNAIILVNSSLYPSLEEKKPATDFYLKNGYTEILSTSNSHLYAKPLQSQK